MPLLSPPRAALVGRALAVCAVLLHPALYAGMFAGDAEVHLVFGQAAAHGRLFEFNPGETVAGETSPGYMLLLAALFRLFPASLVPLMVVGLDIAAWYATLWLTYRLAAACADADQDPHMPPRPWALAAVIIVGLMPGAAYNATTGMENGIFALVFVAWFRAAWRQGWFSRPADEGPTRTDVLATSLLGLGCWIRPEGFVVLAVVLMFRVLGRSRGAGSRPERLRRLSRAVVMTLIEGLPAAALAGAAVLFHRAATGTFLPTSALSRVTVAVDGLRLGGLRFDPKFALRLCAYLPLAVFFAVGAASAFGRWRAERTRPGTSPRRGDLGALTLLTTVFVLFFVLYSTVLGGAHLARYTIFVMPALALVATHGARAMRRRWGGSTGSVAVRWLLVFSAGALTLVYASEADVRRRSDFHGELGHAMGAPQERADTSEFLFRRAGSPTHRPVIVATEEVQIRYWLDERFAVRSLDGRVDPLLLSFVREGEGGADGQINHLGYLAARRVDFLLALPSTPHIRRMSNLTPLYRLPRGESVTLGSLRFTRPLTSGFGIERVAP